MNLIAPPRPIAAFLAISLFALVSFAFPASAPASACAAPQFHQLDFWLGDWETYDYGSFTPKARVRVTRILDGCALHEEYEGGDGLRGESFSIYDHTRNLWHQSWVTNRGELLVIEGTLENGAIVLRGADHTDTGQVRLVRGTWKPISGGVRESAVRSIDGGKTWTKWFDIVFRPTKS